MSWLLRKRREMPPENVRLCMPDGHAIPCDVVRDADQDMDGLTTWIAVPREELPVPGPGDVYQLKMDTLPAKSRILFNAVWME